MRFDLLTNGQLLALSGNKAHLRFIRKGAADELQRRGVDRVDWVDLSVTYRQEAAKRDTSLPTIAKISLLIIPFIPFVMIIALAVGIVAAYLLDSGRKRMWKQIWTWLTFGYVLVTIGIFIYALVMRGV